MLEELLGLLSASFVYVWLSDFFKVIYGVAFLQQSINHK